MADGDENNRNLNLDTRSSDEEQKCQQLSTPPNLKRQKIVFSKRVDTPIGPGTLGDTDGVADEEIDISFLQLPTDSYRYVYWMHDGSACVEARDILLLPCDYDQGMALCLANFVSDFTEYIKARDEVLQNGEFIKLDANKRAKLVDKFREDTHAWLEREFPAADFDLDRCMDLQGLRSHLAAEQEQLERERDGQNGLRWHQTSLVNQWVATDHHLQQERALLLEQQHKALLAQRSDLVSACERSDEATVLRILGEKRFKSQKRSLVNQVDDVGSGPLHISCFLGLLSIVEILLNAGGDPFMLDSQGLSPIHYAIRSGHLGVLEFIYQRMSSSSKRDRVVKACASNNRTPLHQAALYDRPWVTKWLLSCGADTAGHDTEEGNTPLHIAAMHGHTAIVKVLLDAKANPFARNKLGHTPAMVSVLATNCETLTLLLNRGVWLSENEMRNLLDMERKQAALYETGHHRPNGPLDCVRSVLRSQLHKLEPANLGIESNVPSDETQKKKGSKNVKSLVKLPISASGSSTVSDKNAKISSPSKKSCKKKSNPTPGVVSSGTGSGMQPSPSAASSSCKSSAESRSSTMPLSSHSSLPTSPSFSLSLQSTPSHQTKANRNSGTSSSSSSSTWSESNSLPRTSVEAKMGQSVPAESLDLSYMESSGTCNTVVSPGLSSIKPTGTSSPLPSLQSGVRQHMFCPHLLSLLVSQYLTCWHTFAFRSFCQAGKGR